LHLSAFARRTPLERETDRTKHYHMEVHAHHHDHSKRKQLSHYFWDFIMLFLAVFCGFLAENLREHADEHKRAKQYAKALVQDLAKDTIELQSVLHDQKMIITSGDSIGAVIRKGISNNIVPGSFYYFSSAASFAPVVAWNKATLVQLTQSGNLRYFRNAKLINALSYYYVQADYITVLVENDRVKRDKSIELRNRILDYASFTKYSALGADDSLRISDPLMTGTLKLANADKNLLNEFANSIESRKRPLMLLINTVYPQMLEDAKTLIALLKKEYL
jgi:hypothetical protein